MPHLLADPASNCLGGRIVYLLQVAHERSSTELQAVCMEVAGECLPNVVVSFGQLSMYIVLLTTMVLAAVFAMSKACN